MPDSIGVEVEIEIVVEVEVVPLGVIAMPPRERDGLVREWGGRSWSEEFEADSEDDDRGEGDLDLRGSCEGR
jgi:hypothetical protein